MQCACKECLAPPPPDSKAISADVRTLDFAGLGSFDVVVMDPPWQLAGQQPTRGVALSYSQMSDREILALPIEGLSKNGLLFLWTINIKLPMALQMLRKWGYTYAQEVIWVKRTVNRRLAKCHGYYLQHAKETCLVGIKGKGDEWRMGIASDVIYTERREQSKKPKELYDMIEQLVPNGAYLEIFGRRHNLRNKWTTIGNEI
ncbi:hypothetical protein PSACC_00093 [Paramicrosporidium saccamoebae]|uniref:mRNA m(6)A methyltransferase n=1 Tax=Paramicrosporidium saccamoebae TaxID=1246581 RepID=A0A2H9TQS6_9FUNG|nr:hypothetical protein PSACC_00093 [Paramicrosporidium saccamoebae]